MDICPKDPSVLKNDDDTRKILNFHTVVFLLCPPYSLRGDPSLRGKMPVTPRKMVSAQGAPR